MNLKHKAAKRVVGVQPSATVAVSDKARAMAAQGLDVINLGGGEPDFDTPSHIVDAVLGAIRQGHTHYVASSGLRGLRAAIADKLREENGLEFDPDAEIIITPGAKQALFATIMATVDEGDEVLILDPAWVSYVPCVQLASGVAVHVPLSAEDGFRVTEAKLRPKLTSRSKLLIVNSPSNPTGRVFTRQELEAIATVALENDLLVLSDEIYEKILYDGHAHISIGSLPDMQERTMVINGFSKTYAMTGWRLGYVAARRPLAKEILKVQQHSVTCASSFTQYAGIVALTGPQEAVSLMVEEYRRRRDIITEGLNSLPGVSCHLPEGAFYAFPDVSATGMSSVEFADTLLSKARVAVTPGIAFGDSGEGHVRLSFANSTPLIEKAIERMREVL
jgi:aspartate aminotransferase